MLAVPDAIAIIPGCSTFLSWALYLLGIWLTALILWYVGFLAILHTFRFINGAAIITDTGFKLSNLEREVPWEHVRGVCVETQPAFSQLFSFKPEARKLIVFIAQKPTDRLSHRDLPSFFFQDEDFDNFSKYLISKTISQPVSSEWICATPNGDFQRLKKITKLVSISRIFLSILIAFGVATFLGRKALVNYLYNTANRDLSNGNIQLALESYKQVVYFDPTFAAAWHNLATAEFQSHHYEESKRDWQRAILLKPDYVEPKVSLAFIHMKKREFTKAKTLLERARRNDPENNGTLINLTELYFRLGNSRKAMRIARFVLTKDPSNLPAHCLLARSKLQAGNPASAEIELNKFANENKAATSATLFKLVQGEIYLYQHKVQAAESLFSSVLESEPTNEDALLDIARCCILQKQFKRADEYTYMSAGINANNPWVWLIKAEINRQCGNRQAARAALAQAIELDNQDLRSLEESARLSRELQTPQLGPKISQLYKKITVSQ